MKAFSARNSEAINNIVDDALRSLRWEYARRLYGETPIGEVIGADVDSNSRVHAVISMEPRSIANSVLSAGRNQRVDVWEENTLLNTCAPLTVEAFYPHACKVYVGGNATDLRAIERSALESVTSFRSMRLRFHGVKLG